MEHNTKGIKNEGKPRWSEAKDKEQEDDQNTNINTFDQKNEQIRYNFIIAKEFG